MDTAGLAGRIGPAILVVGRKAQPDIEVIAFDQRNSGAVGVGEAIIGDIGIG
ncbi:hypothetical protein D3C71_1929660 [compost metagenome]